jgi:5-methyltetrahydrofolate--homocysteine methyltransferase
MESTVEMIRKSRLDNNFIIMVGGAPVSQRFANEIGADGYAPDAISAVEEAFHLMQIK